MSDKELAVSKSVSQSNSDSGSDKNDSSSGSAEQQVQNQKRQGKKLVKNNKQKKQKVQSLRNKLFEDYASEGSSEDDDDAEVRQSNLRSENPTYLNRKSAKYVPEYMNLNNAEEIEKYLEAKHKDDVQMSEEEDDEVVKQLLPGDSDPKLWSLQIIKSFKEREVVIRLLNKFKFVGNDQNYKIISACSFDHLKGKIYVEAFKKADVYKAIQNIEGIRYNSCNLINKEDIPKIFKGKDEVIYNINVGQFVRIKNAHPYWGDLAQVYKPIDGRNRVGVKVVTREDPDQIKKPARRKRHGESDSDRSRSDSPVNDKKEKKRFTRETRPAPSALGLKATLDNIHCKDLQLENIDPQPAELQIFFQEKDVTQILEENFKALGYTQFSNPTFYKGDKIRCISDNFKNLTGVIESVDGNIAKFRPILPGGQKLPKAEYWEEKTENLIKIFKQGQHIQVVTGRYQNTTGQVLEYAESNVKILTDQDNEIIVRANDLVQSEHVNNKLSAELEQSGLKRLDLIKVNGLNTVGVILSLKADTVTILDSNNQERKVNFMQIEGKQDTRKNVFKNYKGQNISTDAIVIIEAGKYKNIKATVKHVYKDFSFLFSPDFHTESNIVVEKANNCQLQVQQTKKVFLQPRYAADQNMQPVQNLSGKPIDELQGLLGKQIMIQRGQWKNYKGILQSFTATTAKMEIPCKNKIVIIQRTDLGQDQRNLSEGKTPKNVTQSQWGGGGYMQSPQDRDTNWGSTNL